MRSYKLSHIPESPPADESEVRPFNGVSCILPCLNEELNVERAVTTFEDVLEAEVSSGRLISDYEIICVDDGSTDSTSKRLRRLEQRSPRVRLFRHEVNRGYGAALMTGLKAASFDLVFFSDSDNQFDYGQIRELMVAARTSDAVCGFREARSDPFIRKLNALAWNGLIRFSFGYLSRDIDCAFKLFRKTALDTVDLARIRGQGAIINTELLVRMKLAGIAFREIPVRHFPRKAGAPTGAKPSVVARAFKELGILIFKLQLERLRSALGKEY